MKGGSAIFAINTLEARFHLERPNFSRLEGKKYHCHLTYHYVACWTEQKGTLSIEVYYAGPERRPNEVTKTHHIIIRFKPKTPIKVVQAIREQYPKFIETVDTGDSNDELVDITTTDWFKKMDSEMKPKDYLKTYRKVHNLTKSQLSEKIGVSVQYLSDMETGKRTISRKKAKELAEIFGCNPGVFI